MVSGVEVIWYGSQDEALALLAALEHNCACEKNLAAQVIKPCAGHHALAHDQRFVNGLIFVKRELIARLTQEEQRG